MRVGEGIILQATSSDNRTIGGTEHGRAEVLPCELTISMR